MSCVAAPDFVEWREHFVLQERRSRVVHFFLEDASSRSHLAVVGTEESIRPMLYMVPEDFHCLRGLSGGSTVSSLFRCLSGGRGGRLSTGSILSFRATSAPEIVVRIHPGALKHGGVCLVACCISAAEQATVPIVINFDHGNSKPELLEALEMGFDSVMVDGSHLPLKENISYTKYVSVLAHTMGILVEAELGRLSGTEDDLTVEDYEARLTDVNQAQEFIEETGIDALAVCIGNVHGTYPASGPKLRLDLLKDLRALTLKQGVSLVLHGASGLPRELIKECIGLGVRKFNVNTEVRNAYLESLTKPGKDLVHVMVSAKEAMKNVVADKMHLFGSAGKV